MSYLNKLGINYNTDKTSDIHNYLVKYEKYLPFKRDEYLKILEIGVLDGASLRTWKDYFYNSVVHGIDINEQCMKYEEHRIKIEIGSQDDENFLVNIKQKYGPFDMILDDGSHLNSHVIFSFEHLWDSVKSGGVYVVEDCATSYWEDYGGGFRKDTSSIEYFKKLCDDVNYHGIINWSKSNVHARREDWCKESINNEKINCLTNIESINFLNGIIIITKL